jgi:GLPGLI family protein
MKRIVTSLLFLMCLGCVCFSQETIRCRYDFQFKRFPSAKTYGRDSSMIAEIQGHKSIFYSEYYYLRDSTSEAAIAEGMNHIEAAEQMNRYPRGERVIFSIDIRDKSYRKHYFSPAVLEGICDELPIPQWNIEDTYADICGFTCQKATADYLGRKWTVWFTPEIPVIGGPWLLWGTPGLILEATDEESLFRFKAREIGRSDFSRSKAIESRIEEYRKRKNTFFSYPIGKMEQIHYNLRVDILFIDNLIGGGSTVIVDKNGEEVKPSLQPFIPLIPSEYWKSK